MLEISETERAMRTEAVQEACVAVEAMGQLCLSLFEMMETIERYDSGYSKEIQTGESIILRARHAQISEEFANFDRNIQVLIDLDVPF